MQPLLPSDPVSLGGLTIEARLGVGGMGVVYLARQPDGSLVALKVVRPELTEDPAFRDRFTHEARNAMRAHGPFLAQVLEASTSGTPQFVVSRFVPGVNLADRVRDHGPLDADEVCAFAVGLADALSRLHEAGIVHRDVKPSNVQMGEAGPVLLDMGVSKSLDATSMTKSSMSVGSPAWMSPEQLRGLGQGPSGDMWNWATVTAFAASGVHPYGVGTGIAVGYRIVHEAPSVPNLPEPLSTLVARGLATDPGVRPTALEVLRGFGVDHATSTAYVMHRWTDLVPEGFPAAGADAPTLVTSAAVGSEAPTELAATRLQPVTLAPARNGSRSRAVMAVTGIGVALLLGAAVALALTRTADAGSQPVAAAGTVPVTSSSASASIRSTSSSGPDTMRSPSTPATAETTSAVAPDKNHESTESAPVTSKPAAVKWHVLDNVVGDPVYVTLDSYREEPDGSVTLSVDPWSPDLDGKQGSSCEKFMFYDPDGRYCLMNLNTRFREVTLLPDATIWIGDTEATIQQVDTYAASPKSTVVFLRLDAAGHAKMIVCY